MLQSLRDAVPANTRLSWCLQTGALGFGYLPKFGLVPQAIHQLRGVDLISDSVATYLPASICVPLAGFYALKALDLFAPPAPRGIWLGDMFFAEEGFWTGLLITGRPGSGKTSGAILPFMEQTIRMYLGPDKVFGRRPDGLFGMVNNKYARIGGLVLEVKGEFYEQVAYLLHTCGRNVYEDFQIIRPDSGIPVAKFYDPENKNFFFLNACPCSSGSEAGMLLMAAQEATTTTAGSPPIREDIFSVGDAEFEKALPALTQIDYRVEGRDVRYVGWREENGELVRVSHTPAYNKTEYVLNAKKQKIRVPKPRKLQFIDRVRLSNNLRYNLIDRSVGANEAAEKLARMAQMSGRGESKSGDNSYWYNNAQKLIASCIQLHRTLHPGEDTTCAHVYELVANSIHLTNEIRALAAQIVAIGGQVTEAEKVDADLAVDMRMRKHKPLVALKNFFEGEWISLDEKTKGIIKTVVSNTFSIFVLDPALHETFCTKPTFAFTETMQNGRIYCFVPGPYYQTQAKIIGTGLKVDFQMAALSRLNRADLNKARPLFQGTDECWNWVIPGGSGAGDAYFLSMCRQARVFNILATQNYSQFLQEIGRDATDNFLGEFGAFVFLQNMDHFTVHKAEELMEKIQREKFTATSGGNTSLHLFDSNAPGAHNQVSWEERSIYRAEDFIKLSVEEGEAIVFNGYRKHNQALRTILPKTDLTHPDKQGTIANFMRDFLRGSVEQALKAQGRLDRIDPNPKTREPAVVKLPEPHGTPPNAAPGNLPAPEPKTTAKPENNPPPPAPKPDAKSPPTAPPDATIPHPEAAKRANPYRRNYLHFEAHYTADQGGQTPASAPPSSPNSSSPPAGDHGALTPDVVDKASADFTTQWNRLSRMSAELTPELDAHSIHQWVTKILAAQDNAEGPTSHHDGLVGPFGLSGRPPNSMPALPPLPTPESAVPLKERLQAQEAVVRLLREQSVIYREAPGGDSAQVRL